MLNISRVLFTLIFSLIYFKLPSLCSQIIDTNFETVEAILSWIENHNNPKVNNIRIVSENVEFVDTVYSSVNNWNSFTLITGLQVKQYDVKIPSIVLVYLDNLDIDKETKILPNRSISVVNWIEKYTSKKWDHYLFIAKATNLKVIWDHSILTALKWKWGYASDQHTIFTPIQPEHNPLQPTVFKNFGLFRRYFKPQMFAMGHNLRGRKFRYTAWTKAAPYFFISSIRANGMWEFDGTMYRIFNETFKKFNYTNEVHANDGNTYAEYLPNGTWTGIVGDLLYPSRKIDISIHLGPQIVWYDYFDFSNSMTSLKILFVTLQPMPEVHWKAFLQPFSVTVWICLVLNCTIISIGMYIYVKSLDLLDVSLPTSFRYISLITPYKIALEQNTKIIQGTRILSSAWFFVIIITGSAYRTQIISALTFPSQGKLPKTNKELVARPDYKVILNNIGEVEIALFQTSESPAIKALAKRATYESSQFECIKSVILQEKTVCFSWCPMLLLVAAEKAIVDLNVDPFVLSYDAVASSDLSVAFTKDSPYFAGFSYIINAVYEAGFYDLWYNDIYAKQKRKGFATYQNSSDSIMHQKLKSVTDELKDGIGVKPLKIVHLKMMFCIQIIGLSVACSVLFGEYGVHYCKKWICDGGGQMFLRFVTQKLTKCTLFFNNFLRSNSNDPFCTAQSCGLKIDVAKGEQYGKEQLAKQLSLQNDNKFWKMDFVILQDV